MSRPSLSKYTVGEGFTRKAAIAGSTRAMLRPVIPSVSVAWERDTLRIVVPRAALADAIGMAREAVHRAARSLDVDPATLHWLVEYDHSRGRP